MEEYKSSDIYENLSREELIKLVRIHTERSKIILQMEEYSMFRYDVEADTMYLWTCDKETGKVKSIRFPGYKESKPSYFISKKDSARIVDTIEKVLSDPGYPKTGSVQFRHVDGHLIECEYTAVSYSNGTIHSIVGQMVDYFRTTKALKKTIETMNEYIDTIDSLKSGYESVLSANLENHTFKVLKGSPTLLEGLKDAKTIFDLASGYAKLFVEEQYFEGFVNFISPDTLGERLYGVQYISYDYVDKSLGWVHARIVPEKYDLDGNVVQVLFTSEISNREGNLSYLQVAAGEDMLTGLYDRSKGERMVNEWIGLRQPAVFAIFDCDHFKQINDTLGHPVGDIVIKKIARAMREVFPKDVILRLGGDEFVIYHMDTGLASMGKREVLAIFDVLRQRFSEISIPELKGKKITVSGGLVLNRAIQPTNFDKLYHKADIELYRAKQTRNGTISMA